MGLFLRLGLFFAFFVPWLTSAALVSRNDGEDPDAKKQKPDVTYTLEPAFQSGGTHPNGVVVADFNGDGKLDIAVSNFEQNSVAVFLNRGSGIFAPRTIAPIITTVQLDSSSGLNVGGLAVGDFNEDGKPDLVVPTIAGSQVSIVLLGNGDGTFRQQPPIPNSFGFLRAKVADLNGDGHQDLVFAMNGSLGISLGNGDGEFQAMTGLPSPSGLYLGLAVVDFNGDGKLDIVATDFGSPFGGLGTLLFYAGNGDGTFADATAVTLEISSFPGSLASGDFNGDGKQDLLIGFPSSAFVVFGNGDGTFNQSFDSIKFVYFGNSSTFTTNAVTVLAADLEHNGKVDAVTSDFDNGTLQIALNSAIGLFPPSHGIFTFDLEPGIEEVAAGDLNGDGALDVVVINNQTSEVTIAQSHKHGKKDRQD
jgi:hypothetical protein